MYVKFPRYFKYFNASMWKFGIEYEQEYQKIIKSLYAHIKSMKYIEIMGWEEGRFTMRKKMLFIYNPNAGRGKIKSKLSQILDIFSSLDFELIVFPTKKKSDANIIVKEYASKGMCDRIVCSGGDGTLNEVVSGLMECEKSLPVGYIPSGTTNDFGYSLKVPKNMIKAAELAMNGSTLLCDVGSINNMYFTYTAAFGLFTNVSYETSQSAKNMLGRVAYILSGVGKLHNVKSYHLKIRHDNIMIEDDFIYGMISNSDSVGGFKGITGKNVLLNDGLFEMLVIRMPHNLIDLTTIINELLVGVLNSAHIYYSRVSSVSIEAESEFPWTLDGEFGGYMKETVIEIHKQAIPYICLDGGKQPDLIEEKG